MDDCLRAVSNSSDAVNLIKNLQALPVDLEMQNRYQIASMS